MPDDEMQRARQARDDVQRRVAARPEVRLVDIGRWVDPDAPAAAARVAVQVHVSRPLTHAELGLTASAFEIPIRIVPAAEFRLE